MNNVKAIFFRQKRRIIDNLLVMFNHQKITKEEEEVLSNNTNIISDSVQQMLTSARQKLSPESPAKKPVKSLKELGTFSFRMNGLRYYVENGEVVRIVA